MAVPIPAESVRSETEPREESFLHFAARESRVILRWSAIALAGVTVITMITFWFWAIIPALLLLITLAALLIARGIEQYSESADDGSKLPSVHVATTRASVVVKQDVIDEVPVAGDPVESRLIWRESALVILLMISLGLLAVIVSSLLLPANVRWLAILVIFAFMMLAAAPVWLGSIEDDIEDESARLTHRERK